MNTYITVLKGSISTNQTKREDAFGSLELSTQPHLALGELLQSVLGELLLPSFSTSVGGGASCGGSSASVSRKGCKLLV